jgi:3-deoxy-D-manno-octulosonic-acid transferase
MSFPYRSYDLAVRLLRSLSPLAGSGDSKVARGIRGRREAAELLAAWAAAHREADRPLAWFHAPSVGEGLQARAVIEVLHGERPDLQTAYTHFSPSAEGLAEAMPADVSGYLPWDTRPEVGRALDALRPDLMAFTKTEVWPGLAKGAARRGAPVVLVAGTLPPDARRLRLPARRFLRSAFGGLDLVLAVSGDDGERFHSLGVHPDRIQVSGDPAVDSARLRVLQADPLSGYLAPFERPARPTLVAGSTWEPDEAVLIPAATRLRAQLPDFRLVIAPHEPTEEHVTMLERELGRSGWRTARLGEVEARGEAGAADAVVVDRVGVLAHLYTVGRAAYVGGGFHSHGLHSVLEPAAAQVPVAFGPAHVNARAAGDLLAGGGACQVADAGDLVGVLHRWFGDDGETRAAGACAGRYIDEHAGAAGRTAGILASLLPPLPERRVRAEPPGDGREPMSFES